MSSAATNPTSEQQASSQNSNSRPERKPRGTFPPFLRLGDAVELARKVNERAAGLATYDLFSQISGNTKTSSAFQKKVGALRQYGIADEKPNMVALTELGNRVVAPMNPGDDLIAIKEAMLRIDTLNRLYERHRGRLLPEDPYLKNIIEQELRLPRDVSGQWVDWFKDALAVAKLTFERGDGKTQVLDTPSFIAPLSVAVTDSTSPNWKDSVQAVTAPATMGSATVAAERSAYPLDSDRVMPIPLGRGRLAKVELPEDWDSSKDLNRFLKMLRLSLSEDGSEEEP